MKNKIINCFNTPSNKKYVCEKIDPKLKNEYLIISDELLKRALNRNSKGFQTLYFVLFLLFVLIIVQTVKSLDEKTVEGFFVVAKRTWYLYLILFILVCITFIMHIIIKNINKKKDEDLKLKSDDLIKRIDAFYGFPTNCIKVDVLTCDENDLDLDSGEDSFIDIFDYTIQSCAVYTDNTYIYFNNVFYMIRLPLDASFTFIDINDDYYSDVWNKIEPYNSEHYSKYGIEMKGYDYVIKCVKVLVTFDNDACEFYIPNYEKEVIEKLINK